MIEPCKIEFTHSYFFYPLDKHYIGSTKVGKGDV